MGTNSLRTKSSRVNDPFSYIEEFIKDEYGPKVAITEIERNDIMRECKIIVV